MRNHGLPWTAAQDEMIRRLAPTTLAREVAQMIGRTTGAVLKRSDLLGVRFEAAHRVARFGERVAALAILPDAEWVAKDDYLSPFDLLWGGLWVDVKTSQPRMHGRSRCWAFELHAGRSDWFLCLGLNHELRIDRAWMIPALALSGQKSLAIGVHRSKYDRFRIPVPAAAGQEAIQ